ncbi:MAG: hypothetical protein ALAOOOJD_01765 [bacterium]|nr:hypothetical protein [bacterium]
MDVNLLTQSNFMRATVLVIDSDSGVVNAFGKSLERQGFAVWGTSSVRDGLQALRQLKPRALILDIQAPGPPGIELLREVRALYPALPIIATTAYSTSFTAADAKQAGADGYFVKPFDYQALIDKLKAVVCSHTGAVATLLALYHSAAAPLFLF